MLFGRMYCVVQLHLNTIDVFPNGDLIPLPSLTRNIIFKRTPLRPEQPRQSLAYLSPETLHHPQRRLVAALSKIIFFTHSAAGTDWPLGGTAERLALDTRDLGAAVRMYVDEVVRVGCLADPPRGKGLKRPPEVVVPGVVVVPEVVVPGVVLVPDVAVPEVVVLVRVVSVVTELLVFESAPVRDTSDEPVQEAKRALAQNAAAETRMANSVFFVSFIRPGLR